MLSTCQYKQQRRKRKLLNSHILPFHKYPSLISGLFWESPAIMLTPPSFVSSLSKLNSNLTYFLKQMTARPDGINTSAANSTLLAPTRSVLVQVSDACFSTSEVSFANFSSKTSATLYSDNYISSSFCSLIFTSKHSSLR